MQAIALLILASSLSYTIYGQSYDETIDGDLSDQFDNPTGPFVLDVGDIIITANQQSDDVDYFSITIPEELELDMLILDDYNAEDPTNQAFLGLQEGLTFTTDAMSTTAADLLGGITYGSQDIDTNLLIDMNAIGTGFGIPLPAGNYTFWLNQTGPNSEARLRFVVSENLSVNEFNLQNGIKISPNPVLNYLTVQTTRSITMYDLSVIDITGKRIMSITYPNTVNLQTLAAGIYFGVFTTSKGILTKKIIKQ